MVFQETLDMIENAFRQIPESELNGWGLDPMGWNYNGNQETDDTDIHLLRGERERASVTILPEGIFEERALQQEILTKMRAKGLI
jgi:hypothetical protein